MSRVVVHIAKRCANLDEKYMLGICIALMFAGYVLPGLGHIGASLLLMRN